MSSNSVLAEFGKEIAEMRKENDKMKEEMGELRKENAKLREEISQKNGNFEQQIGKLNVELAKLKKEWQTRKSPPLLTSEQNELGLGMGTSSMFDHSGLHQFQMAKDQQNSKQNKMANVVCIKQEEENVEMNDAEQIQSSIRNEEFSLTGQIASSAEFAAFAGFGHKVEEETVGDETEFLAGFGINLDGENICSVKQEQPQNIATKKQIQCSPIKIGNTLKCNWPNCEYQTKSTYFGRFMQHWQIHCGERPYLCIICGKKFKKVSSLKSHERIHTEERTYPCQKCGQIFKRSNELHQHEQMHNLRGIWKSN